MKYAPFARRKKMPKKNAEDKEVLEAKDVCCKKCVWAYLMQSEPYNPLVAECIKTKIRNVAETMRDRSCGFIHNTDEIVIHPMIKLK